MPLTGVILDIDGTLLLSNDAHARAWVDAYEQFGYEVPFEKVQPLIGMGGDKLMQALTPELNESEGTGKKIKEARQQIFLERYLDTLQPAPGGRQLLEKFLEEGLKLTIATSAKSQELNGLLERANIKDLIGDTATSDDAESSKPDPDIVGAAIEKSGQHPDEVLMLGDTPYDVEAAGRARVETVAVRCGGHDEDLREALAVYDDPADILRQFSDSPFAQRLAAQV